MNHVLSAASPVALQGADWDRLWCWGREKKYGRVTFQHGDSRSFWSHRGANKGRRIERVGEMNSELSGFNE